MVVTVTTQLLCPGLNWDRLGNFSSWNEISVWMFCPELQWPASPSGAEPLNLCPGGPGIGAGGKVSPWMEVFTPLTCKYSFP